MECTLLCPALCFFQHLSQRERVGEMITSVHTRTMTKAEDN